MIRYYLSGNQHKELTERGRRLRIAVPLPDDAPAGVTPTVLAKSLLEVDPAHVIGAEVVEVPVQVRVGAPGPGLTGMLGDLVHDHAVGKTNLVVRVVCVVVDLQSGRVARAVGRTQWPGYVVIEGRRYG